LQPPSFLRLKTKMRKSSAPFVLLIIIGAMCALNCAQALAPVPYIPRPPGIKQQEWSPNVFSDKCDLCVSVLTAIAKLATLNDTQVAIMTYVQSICSYLPQAMQTECELMVEIGTPVLINFLIEEMGPKVLCQDINLCNSTASPSPTPSPPKPTPPTDRCVMCEFVVSTLQGLLANESVEKQFLAECAEACIYLPLNEQQPCQSLIQNYGATAMLVVLKYATPSFVCEEARIC